MKRRLEIARGLLHSPRVIFLDEPTLGLDVNASIAIRNYIRHWVKGTPGRTVLLTTHYMAEADTLCDRVAIIDQGRILACDTPKNLRRLVKGSAVFTISTSSFQGHEGIAALTGVRGYDGRWQCQDALLPGR